MACRISARKTKRHTDTPESYTFTCARKSCDYNSTAPPLRRKNGEEEHHDVHRREWACGHDTTPRPPAHTAYANTRAYTESWRTCTSILSGVLVSVLLVSFLTSIHKTHTQEKKLNRKNRKEREKRKRFSFFCFSVVLYIYIYTYIYGAQKHASLSLVAHLFCAREVYACVCVCVCARREKFIHMDIDLLIHFFCRISTAERRAEKEVIITKKNVIQKVRKMASTALQRHAHRQSTRRHYERTEIKMKRRRGGTNFYDTFWKQRKLHRRFLSIQTCTEEVHAIILLLTVPAVLIVLSDGCADRNTVRHAAEDVRGNVTAFFR